MERLTNLTHTAFSFFDLLLTSAECLTRQLGTVYEFCSVLYQFLWHIIRIGTERSASSVVSGRDWLNKNSSNLNRYGSLIGLILLVSILIYIFI